MRASRFGVLIVGFCLLPAALHAQCLGDGDNSGTVTVDEIVTAVNNALHGCPDGPSPTPTDTVPPTPTSTPTSTFTPSVTPSRTATPSVTFTQPITATFTSTLTPSVTLTPTSSPSLTPTANAVAIDFGPAGGGVGGQTTLPFVGFPGIVAASLDITVDFPSDFDFLSCSGSGLSIIDTPETFNSAVRLQIDVLPPRQLGPGTFMECSFQVGESFGNLPVSLSGSITDTGGNVIPVIAEGFFDINPECTQDFDCLTAESCVNNRCVTRTPTSTPTRTPTSTQTPTRTSTPTRSATSSPTVTSTRTPTRTATRTPTHSVTPTLTPTRTPTRTSTSTPTFTQSITAIDFGPAGGTVGSFTALPFEIQSALVVSSMSFVVQYNSSAFSFDSCSGFDLDINATDFGGSLQIAVTVDPPRLLFQGEFMSCLFQVIGSSDVYPVSLEGTIVDGGGGEIPVAANGTFTINPQCFNDFDCNFDESCVDERCVENTPTPTVTQTMPPTATGTPTQTPTLTLTPTPTLPPTLTPTPTLGPGPRISYLGILSASNQVVASTETLPDGTPVFAPPTGLGFGFFIVIEAEMGTSGALPGTQLFNNSGRPDLQIQTNRNLGNGSLQVCDANGIPGINPPSFDEASSMITDALNDFSCRFEVKSQFQPCQGSGGFIHPDSDAQVCTQGTVTTVYEFPSGDTRLTVRWRDQLDNLGPPASIIVRVS